METKAIMHAVEASGGRFRPEFTEENPELTQENVERRIDLWLATGELVHSNVGRIPALRIDEASAKASEHIEKAIKLLEQDEIVQGASLARGTQYNVPDIVDIVESLKGHLLDLKTAHDRFEDWDVRRDPFAGSCPLCSLARVLEEAYRSLYEGQTRTFDRLPSSEQFVAKPFFVFLECAWQHIVGKRRKGTSIIRQYILDQPCKHKGRRTG